MMELAIKCAANTEVTAYLYGEMPASEADNFEKHLANCDICADEFAAISFARYSVYEWNKVEFAPLETPVINIDLAESRGWLTTLKGLFVPAPGLAFGGAAVIMAATLGLVYLVWSGSGPEVAVVPSQATTPSVVERLEVQPEKVMAANDEPIEPSEDVQTAPRTVAVNTSTARKSTGPVKRALNRSRSAPPAIAINAQAEELRLNEFDDLEGDGLRLADLVADLDSE